MKWCCQGSAWLWWTIGASTVIALGSIIATYRYRSSGDLTPSRDVAGNRNREDTSKERSRDGDLGSTHPSDEPRVMVPPEQDPPS